MLTKDDITAFRKADQMAVHLSSDHPNGLVRLIKRKPYNAGPFEDDKEYRVTTVKVQMETFRGNEALAAGTAKCFELVSFYHDQGTPASSIIKTLRIGDDVTLSFYPDCHSNGYVAAQALHADCLYLRVRRDGMHAVGDSFRELVLINSHDGTSSYQLFSGVFRIVCSNGLLVAEGQAQQIRIPHKGDIVSQVIDGAFTIIEQGAAIDTQIADMRMIELRPAEQEAFAEAAASLRFDGDVPVQPRQINQARRRDDVGNDLWRTFNRAQENLIRGDITYNHTNDQGQRSRRTTRPVNGIDGNVALNRAMWALASKMQELKAA
jgi:hypothetical protein